MTRFIPRDTTRAEALETRLSQTIFQNPDTFVQYYNSGMINRTNDETKEIVKELVETFKDVRERKSKLAFISVNEILLDEALTALTPWSTLVRVKREVSDAVQEKTIDTESTLLITEDGNILVIGETEDGAETQENIGADKLKTNEVEIIANKTSLDELHDNGYLILASDLLNLDDSFIGRIKEEIPEI